MTKPTVLIADDEPVSREVVSMRLSMLGTQVIGVENGIAAMDLLGTRAFDAAIVDLDMPGADGFAVLDWARSHATAKHTPIVVLTGSEDRAHIDRALALGAAGYLVKPVKQVTLEDCLRPLLQRHHRVQPTA